MRGIRIWALGLAFALSLLETSFACGYVSAQLGTWTAESARAFGLEPELLVALVWIESRYCPEAISSVGAIGLGQLMPGTAQSLGVNPRDARQNLHGAAKYLRLQWDTFRDWNMALAAYNAGPGAVRRYGGVPPYRETQNYVRSVLYVYFALKHR